LRRRIHACHMRHAIGRGGYMHLKHARWRGESSCMSYEEEDTCMSFEEEDTCMPYEACHRQRRIHALEAR
jgi:hypothetical protein